MRFRAVRDAAVFPARRLTAPSHYVTASSRWPPATASSPFLAGDAASSLQTREQWSQSGCARGSRVFRSSFAILLLVALASAQDAGGRDTGKGIRPVIFVRSARDAESAAIYRVAWKALEPHYGVLSRERMYNFDGELKRATRYFAAHERARLVVAFDTESASWTPKDRTLLRVGVDAAAHIDTRTDRTHFARLMRSFRPRARRIALFGSQKESLRGYELVRCRVPEDAKGCDAAWITEDALVDVSALRRRLDAWKIPLVSTSPNVAATLPALSVRPDPRGLGLLLAAQLLDYARHGRAFRRMRVGRHRVVVDLSAARAGGVRVPLELLARADVVRKSP